MISFEFAEVEVDFIDFDKLNAWIKQVIRSHKKQPGNIQYIIGSDEYILDINRTYLEHDYYTDIITFDYCEGKTIAGDIFVSLDRILDNAKKLQTSEPDEFNRVMIHGILHLIGFKDKTDSEAKEMRRQENLALDLIED